MGIRKANSTNYIHPDESNQLELHRAMDYNEYGQPVIRVTTSSSTISGSHIDGSRDYFGELFAIPLVPVVQLNSYEGFKERDAQLYTGGGGSVTDLNTAIYISCTSTLGSYGVYRSRRFVPYRAGQTNTARILAKFDTPVAGTQQRIGVANQENAYYVGYNGTDLQFLHSHGGRAEIWELDVDNTATDDQTITLTLNDVVYTIAIADTDPVNEIASKIANAVNDDVWLATSADDKVRLLSGTLGNKTGTFSFSSTGNVAGTLTEKASGVAATDEWEDMTLPDWFNSTVYNHWQFRYSWDGVTIFLLNHATNQWYLVHRHHALDDLDLPVTKPSFKIAAVAYNTGGSDGVTVFVASMAGFVEGEEQITTYTHGGGVTKTSLASDSYHHIMSIQNPFVADSDNWRLNYRHIRFLDLTVAAQINDPGEIYIFFDAPLTGGVVHEWIGYTNRIYQSSTVTGVVDHTTDTPVVALIIGNTGSQAQFDLRPYNLIIPPGAHMTLAAKSGASFNKITIGGTWASIG